ncbi:MAG TPA: CAP domain-containing protein [Candidatus Caenarcaniphilales bacterium]
MINQLFAPLVIGLAIATAITPLPIAAQVCPPPAPSPAPATTLSTLEQSVHTQINQYRASRSLPPLTLDSRISQQARTHSQNMASGLVAFGHDGFSQRVQVITQVIPLSSAAENVAYNQGSTDPARQAVQGWIASSGHQANIVGSYNLTGIGVAMNASGRYYFTQIFIRTR